MRRTRLAVRLALRNLRRRPAQALLLLVTLTIATGVLGVAATVQGSADAPWDRAWRATNGFHVGLTVYHPPDEPGDRAVVAQLRRRAERLAGDPRVTAAGGPWTHLYGSITVAGGQEDLTAEVRDPGPYRVDQPLVTAGRWLGDGGGVVLESGLAATLAAGPGDTVTIQGRPFPVRGVAITVSRGRFPLSRPAQVWATPETARQLRGLGMTEEGFELQLRLADPDEAAAFVAAHRDLVAANPSPSVVAYLETWRQRRADSHSDLDILAGTLYAAGTLIAILTVATAAVLVAGRMAAQVRRVGTLKAVGVTPRQVALVLLVEHLVVAAGATAAGLGIGRLLGPRVAAASVTVLGRPAPPPLTPARVALVAAVAVAVVLYDQVRAVVLATAGLLLVLGTINAVIVAAFAARDAARNHAVLRAVGTTPRQTVAALVVSQLGACAIAVAGGTPLGLGLWSLMDGGDLPPVRVPAASLLLLAAAVPVAFAAVVSVPAWRLARRPVSPLLAYE